MKLIVWIDSENIANWSPLLDWAHKYIDEVQLFIGHLKYKESTLRYFRSTYKNVVVTEVKADYKDALDYELLGALFESSQNHPEDIHIVVSNDKIYAKYKLPNVLYLSNYRAHRRRYIKDFIELNKGKMSQKVG